jgi:hypothetical protein
MNTKEIQISLHTSDNPSSISFTNGTRVITVSNRVILRGKLIHIINFTQNISYFIAVGTKILATATNDGTNTTITIDNSYPVLATGDEIQIDYRGTDSINNYDLGYSAVGEVSPANLKFDSTIVVASVQAPTTSWATLGSAFSMEGSNAARCQITFVQGGSLTGLYFKVIGRKSAGDTVVFPVESIKFDKTSRVTLEEDTTDVGVVVYKLVSTASQKFSFTIYTDNCIPELEIQIKGVGTMTSSTVTLDLNKAWLPATTCESNIVKTSQVVFDDSANLDAFGRLRTSSPITKIDTQFQYNDQPLFWQSKITGTGTVTHLPNEAIVSMNVPVTSGDSIIRQTYSYFRYTSGKSQLVLMTGIIGTAVTNCTKRMGLFDANNGIFLEQAGSTVNIVLRTYTSGSMAETRVAQASWNIDKLDGTGKSGMRLDLSKSQILFIDFEWLGVGRVRVGFNIDGKFQVCHVFNNANNITSVYMATPHLPLRYEVVNTGTLAGVTSLKQICSTVITEDGDDHDHGIGFTASNGITTINGINGRVPVLSIRPKATFNSIVNRGTILPTSIDIYSSQTIYWELVYGGTLTTTPSFSSVSANSITEKDVASTVITGGEVLMSGYLVSGNTVKQSISKDIFTKLPLTLDIDGANPKNLSVVVTDFSTNADVSAVINFTDIY